MELDNLELEILRKISCYKKSIQDYELDMPQYDIFILSECCKGLYQKGLIGTYDAYPIKGPAKMFIVGPLTYQGIKMLKL